MEKTITPTLIGTALLIASVIGLAPATSADHEDGHTEIEAGPVTIELQRLEPRIPVTVAGPQVMLPVQKIGEIAAVTVTIEDVQGADNTTFTIAGFGFNNACDIVLTLPLVRDCEKVPGTTQIVQTFDPDATITTLQKCLFGLRVSVSIGPFDPFVSTGELLTPVDGPCPA